MASCFSYLIIYYQSVGISIQEIGVLLTLPTLITVFGNPVWSAAADAFHLHKWMLPLCLFLTIPAILLVAISANFFMLAVFLSLYTFVGSPIISLADYATVNMLGEKRNEYGKLRVWGAVGFGLSSLLVGSLIEHFGIRLIFPIYIVLMSINVLVATRLPRPRLLRSAPFWTAIGLLIRDRRWYAFLGSLFLTGMAFATINNFLILFIKSKDAGESLFGMATAVAGVGELPVFFFAAILLSRWKAKQLVLSAMLFLVLRCLLISMVTNPYWILPIQLLHGLTFSLLWAAGVNYANEIAPQGLGASAQALMGVTLYNIGGGTGSVIGTQLYDLVGVSNLFRLGAFLAFVGFIFLLVLSGKSKTSNGVEQAST